MNLARAVGPAAAGLLIAQLSIGAVFTITAATYVVMAVVVLSRGPRRDPNGTTPERFVPALRAGARYVRHTPVMHRLLLHAAGFVLSGTALWALLPLVATRSLHLGSSGYGLLLAALGVGAIGGAVLLPKVTARVSSNAMLLVGSLLYACAQVGVVLIKDVAVVVLLLLPAGAAWLAVLSSVYAATQMWLPTWVRARGLSVLQIVLVGGQAVSAFIWGLVAQLGGLVVAFVAASLLMALGSLTVLFRPLLDVEGVDRDATVYWPEPVLPLEPDPDEGPVLITVTFRVPPENAARFLDAMTYVKRTRSRTGATRWALYRDASDPIRFVETFLVPSWQEHLRQHRDRLTGADQSMERAAAALAEGTPHVEHLLPARAPK
jgi:quinol monooxygenase YgiN